MRLSATVTPEGSRQSSEQMTERADKGKRRFQCKNMKNWKSNKKHKKVDIPICQSEM